MFKSLAGWAKLLPFCVCLLAAPAPAAYAQGAHVTEAFLKADEARVSASCPVRVVFRGYIRADGPGTVKYTFTRSDGTTSPVQEMEFKEAGTQEVATDWTLGDERVLPAYEGWQAIKILSPNELESNRETGAFSIKCRAARAATGEQTPATNVSGDVKGSAAGNLGSGNAATGGGGGDGSARGVIPSVSAACYLVTLNGFTVNHPTSDDALRRDGAGDEVFLNSPATFRFGSRGALLYNSAGAFGPGFGERRPNETEGSRHQAGRATPNGGLQAGDSFPPGMPWRRESPCIGLGIPHCFYSGPLGAGELLVVVPSIWEWDGADNDLSESYVLMMHELEVRLSSRLSQEGYQGFVNRVLSGGGVPVVKTFTELGITPTVSIGLGPFNPGSRPVGMRLPRGQGDRAFFDPQVLFLTPEAAEYMTRNNAYRLGAGVMPLRYRDDPDLEGDYTLYVQTERAECVGDRP